MISCIGKHEWLRKTHALKKILNVLQIKQANGEVIGQSFRAVIHLFIIQCHVRFRLYEQKIL